MEYSGTVYVLVVCLTTLITAWILIRIVRGMFRRAQERNAAMHLVFFEHLFEALIIIAAIIIALSAVDNTRSIGQMLLGSTAIASAVGVYVAQDVIKDILAGLMLSLHKPFVVGDRIELENGTIGIVEDITMRHVVISGFGTSKIVIPNRKINEMQIKNYHYRTEELSYTFTFSIGYDADVDQAKFVVEKAIEESPYTLPDPHAVSNKETEGSTCGKVYFTKMGESALELTVTVYYDVHCSATVLKDDINTRVRRELTNNGIEIPYNYLNVVNVSKENVS